MADPRASLPRHPSRLAFLGTPEVAVPVLHALVEEGFDVALVITGVDKRRGRRGEPRPTPVKAAALEMGLPVSHEVDDVMALDVDLAVVVAFGRLISADVLARVPMINLHFSELPRWRGAAPVERAILAGDATTAVCIMQIVQELDAGGVLRCDTTPIGEDESLDELRGRLAEMGAASLVETLRAGLPSPVPQTGEVTYAAKIRPEEHRLDWARPAAELSRVIRLGRAWSRFRDARFKVLRARVGPERDDLAPGELDVPLVGTGSGTLELIEVQPEGRARQGVDAWHNGARPQAGERLSS